MKTVIAVAVFVAFVVAEPPPSHSYLPPSPGNQGYQGSGFSGSGPQVLAARSLEGHSHGPRNYHGAQGNGFARNGHHGPQARFSANGDQGYDQNAAPFGRNSLDDANPEPANYNFGYMVNDYQEGTDFGHHEERQEEKAHGEYHVVLPDGRKQTVSYEADERGFKPQISYQDSEFDVHGRSNGYDSNAHNVRSNGGGHHGNGRNGYN